eukprot:jgi/Mesvir1/14710/Mv26255-RA.1
MKDTAKLNEAKPNQAKFNEAKPNKANRLSRYFHHVTVIAGLNEGKPIKEKPTTTKPVKQSAMHEARRTEAKLNAAKPNNDTLIQGGCPKQSPCRLQCPVTCLALVSAVAVQSLLSCMPSANYGGHANFLAS